MGKEWARLYGSLAEPIPIVFHVVLGERGSSFAFDYSRAFNIGRSENPGCPGNHISDSEVHQGALDETF